MQEKHEVVVGLTTLRQAGQEKNKEEALAVHRFETEPAVVRMQYGVTMNLGNYESARIDVGISVPCYKEQIEETAEWAKAWVEKRVLAEVQEVQAGRKKNLF